MSANFPGVGTALNFQKRKKNSSLRAYVLHSKWHTDISRRGRAVTIKKFTRKCAACVRFLFCALNLLLF